MEADCRETAALVKRKTLSTTASTVRMVHDGFIVLNCRLLCFLSAKTPGFRVQRVYRRVQFLYAPLRRLPTRSHQHLRFSFGLRIRYGRDIRGPLDECRTNREGLSFSLNYCLSRKISGPKHALVEDYILHDGAKPFARIGILIAKPNCRDNERRVVGLPGMRKYRSTFKRTFDQLRVSETHDFAIGLPRRTVQRDGIIDPGSTDQHRTLGAYPAILETGYRGACRDVVSPELIPRFVGG